MASCPNSTVPITHNNGSMPSPFIPSVPGNVTLSLTVFYLIMYFALFISVYIQLWLILFYNYKRFSFQTVFLFLCACWSALRATLFSFYFKNTVVANELPVFAYWLLYCFPVCLQFFTLCLLNLYFAQVMFKAKPKYAANPNKYIYPLRTFCIVAIVIFLGMNVSCAIVVQTQQNDEPQVNLIRAIVVARVLVNDLLFVICAVSLAYCIFKISKTTSANILLEAKGTTVCQAVSVGIVIVLLYASRAIYNLLAISPLRCSKLSSFNFNWYNVSDQADLVNLNGSSYIVFGVVLFIWELLPTTLTIIFFRVKKNGQSVQTSISAITPNGYNTRVYFFDNPHRYDSEEDLTTGRSRGNGDSSGFLQVSAHHIQQGSPRRNSSKHSPGRRLTHSTPPIE
uniref:Integral membrane protein GPR137B-like n=1 Tax=Phallusia mammillata TaxID=59560 RepID=A0A6F9DDF0_9ASCI|nr:integral membrane protein GPR137B-like [Phallusia mammillata]